MSRSYSFDSVQVVDCDIVGSVVQCLLRDMKVNFFCFSGFPSIGIDYDEDGEIFIITLSRSSVIKSSFCLTKEQAINTSKRFRAGELDHDKSIFKIVQRAISEIDSFD